MKNYFFPFIKSRAYATQLGWGHDKYVRDTGAYVKGKYYGDASRSAVLFIHQR